MALLKEINDRYVALHQSKEEAFWIKMMGLEGHESAGFEQKEIALNTFRSDIGNLKRVTAELERDDLSEEERTGLEGWERFFQVNAMESGEAKKLSNRIVELESKLDRARRDMELGYTDPQTGKHVPASSVKLALMIMTADKEEVRKAAWEGLRSIEPFVLENGFIEIVKQRNKLAHMLGHEDYYDYKVTINEGFGKARLFELLDELERDTRDACKRSLDRLAEEKGKGAIEAWNMGYHTSGNTSILTDPYLRFDQSFNRWGRTFSALGVKYRGASLQLDLVDRKGKYENGFMHGTFPAYVDEGTFRPADINFTANAVPGQTGSGSRAINTFLHEGGHAAHFSNIEMPAPCFSQEFAPTSVAFAETQSMFFDSLLGDADWLIRYAKNESGESIPVELIKKIAEDDHRYLANVLRKMLVVSYAEKALYEMSDEELTAENILKMLRELERKLTFQPASARPVLSIPHLLAGESSAYYHGYTLARMAVFQTKDYFNKKYGYIMDNPNIGPELAERYWVPGNSKTFLEMVHDLTGEPFSARATVDLVNKALEEVFADVDRMIEREQSQPVVESPVDLDAHITIVHGNEVVASTQNGESFEEVGTTFAAWINELE